MTETKQYVLITGASSGIGETIAKKLAEEKKQPLILCGRDETRLNAVKNFCDEKNDHSCEIWKYDLSNVDHLADDFKIFLKEKNLAVSGFVHSAGVLGVAPLRLISSETMSKTMNTNFCSAVEILKVLASKRSNAKNLKNVVFISAINAARGAQGFSVYGASKAALEGFARAMAIELAPEIRVNCIAPGAIKMTGMTQMFQKILTEDAKSKPFEQSVLGDGTPDDIANMVLFLLSEKARWITGQTIGVDGGWLAH